MATQYMSTFKKPFPIPATQEVELRRTLSKAGLGKSVRLYLKYKLKSKGLGT
jgi:hypothetical protein